MPKFPRFAAAAAFTALPFAAFAQQSEFNVVGREMAKLLQNNHFSGLAFNDALSQRFLHEYLRNLDPERLYFTQADVDGFRAKFGDRLDDLLITAKSMDAATEIYRTFRKRVEERVTLAGELLKAGNMAFTGEEAVPANRTDAVWARNEAEAAEVWRLKIKEAVLSETLRMEALAQAAAGLARPAPGKHDRTPAEKVSLRYQRFLQTVKSTDDEEIAGLFLSAVATAHDPYTDYLSAREMGRFNDELRNETVGIGALLQADDDGATVITGIVVGGPADREGSLKLNDRIIAVDPLNTGKPGDMVDIRFLDSAKVLNQVRGREKTAVALKIEPAGGAPGETRIIVIERGKVELKNEKASGEVIEMASDDGGIRRVGVITLPSFYADFENGTTRSSVDVERILVRLAAEKIEGLVLDLRNNGGGSVEEVRRMTGFFLNQGPVVQVKPIAGPVQVKEGDHRRPIYSGPLVVMTDKNSASASEILAGALQDYNRAVIIGESSTYGKGTVQQTMGIGDYLPLFANRGRAGFLKVTTQKFYRPSGSSTQREGVVPQIVLPSLTDALEIGEAYLENTLPHDRIRPAPGFRARDIQALFLPRLKELSQERVGASKDFTYIIEDALQMKERAKRNQLSLNLEKREAEIAGTRGQQRLRNAERKDRFTAQAETDRKHLKFFKLTLDDLDANRPPREYDPAAANGDFIRTAEARTLTPDESPGWPSGLDPVKRESLMVAKDLVDLTRNAELAGLLRKG